ncbi:DUF58 domain-containing protein [Candidatus Chrysopegis kryptomonas]|uniref:VWFA domain-containing protein n=1 Tax=Candidatus Chryseopegocella kryptomonas TaxID=1633643 RepID=A0A0P1MQ71_9BACT|nr:DUF58 domain-containing protein [Candidatus Chrysopegis kryptomonas]CUS97605.1 Protein of unknown function DUF58 [Candidatus Chrysopegis kryptomonas]
MQENHRKYLDPKVVSKLSNLELIARLVVEGFIVGLHKSPYHGFSVEFSEHRQYSPGDETRYIDWKVYGRTDRYFIKQFEEETNLRAYIILDASGSMAYSSGDNVRKFDYACYLAGALAYLMMMQRDAVGLVIYDEGIRKFLPPRSVRSYLDVILSELERTEPGSKTNTAKSLHLVAERIKRRGLVIVLSDLLDDQNEVISAFKHFKHKKNEIIVFQILDPVERNFDFNVDALFKDMETSEKIMTQSLYIRKDYQRAIDEFIKRYRIECLANGIDYELMDTATPFDVALFRYLSKRRELM